MGTHGFNIETNIMGIVVFGGEGMLGMFLKWNIYKAWEECEWKKGMKENFSPAGLFQSMGWNKQDVTQGLVRTSGSWAIGRKELESMSLTLCSTASGGLKCSTGRLLHIVFKALTIILQVQEDTVLIS